MPNLKHERENSMTMSFSHILTTAFDNLAQWVTEPKILKILSKYFQPYSNRIYPWSRLLVTTAK